MPSKCYLTGMRYNTYTYLYPPRPEKAVPPEMIPFHEKRGYVSQIKMNGTCNVLAVSPTKEIVAMNRHKEPHKAWEPNEDTAKDFANLPGNGWYVFVAELMHSKIPGLRNINYVHDILVANGEYLVGKTFEQRQEILYTLLKKKNKSRELLSHFEISPTLWLAKTFQGDHRALYDKLERPEYEGLVLKNPKATLDLCLKEKDNASWQVKVRKTHKNYSF